MGFVAFVVLPLVVVIWLITSIGLWFLRDAPGPRDWLMENRWWLVWPLMCAYIGLAAGWWAALAVLVPGVLVLAVVRHRILSGAITH